MQQSTFQMTKKVLSDPLCGNISMIEPVMEAMIAFMHAVYLTLIYLNFFLILF